jgi:hypothetical protein
MPFRTTLENCYSSRFLPAVMFHAVWLPYPGREGSLRPGDSEFARVDMHHCFDSDGRMLKEGAPRRPRLIPDGVAVAYNGRWLLDGETGRPRRFASHSSAWNAAMPLGRRDAYFLWQLYLTKPGREQFMEEAELDFLLRSKEELEVAWLAFDAVERYGGDHTKFLAEVELKKFHYHRGEDGLRDIVRLAFHVTRRHGSERS